MLTFFSIYKQIVIFLFYAVLAYLMTSLVNNLFRSKRILSFIIPILVLLTCIVLFILGMISPSFKEQGFIEYSILGFFAFIGSCIASLAFFFPSRKN